VREEEKRLSYWAELFYEKMSEFISEPPKFIELRSYGYAIYEDD